MRLRTAYKLHRWIAICFGVVLLNQVISGAVMILPRGERSTTESQSPIDYRSIMLSPADALEALAQDVEGDALGRPVRAVNLRPVLGQIFYEVSLHGGATYLIDAESGETKKIGPEIAAEIARSALGSAFETRQVERLERHDYRWRHGALPVYRVTLEGPGVWVVYVSAGNGAVLGRSDRWGRIQGLIGSFHQFEPVGWLFGSNRTRKAALLFSAFVGVATALTGYFLALPRGQKRGERRAEASSSG